MTAYPNNIGLALGGGGACGWAHLGIINHLEEHGVNVSSVAGTSIGALVGAFYAARRINALREVAANYTKRDYFRLFNPRLIRAGLFQSDKIVGFLEDYFGDTRIEDLPVGFAAVTTDLTTGTEDVLTEGRLVDAVRASIAIPVLFTPFRQGVKVLADGGLSNPVPVDVARKLTGDPVVGVDLNYALKPAEERVMQGRQKNMLSVMLRSIRISQRQLAITRYALTAPQFLIKPPVGDIKVYEFYKAQYAISKGYQAAACEIKN